MLHNFLHHDVSADDAATAATARLFLTLMVLRIFYDAFFSDFHTTLCTKSLESDFSIVSVWLWVRAIEANYDVIGQQTVH